MARLSQIYRVALCIQLRAYSYMRKLRQVSSKFPPPFTNVSHTVSLGSSNARINEFYLFFLFGSFEFDYNACQDLFIQKIFYINEKYIKKHGKF